MVVQAGGSRPAKGARLLRGIAAGSLTTFLALAFHVAGGGHAPSILATGACLAVAVWTCILIGGRRLRLPVLIAAVGASQVALHAMFTVMTAEAMVTVGDAHALAHGDASGTLSVAVVHTGHAMWLAHLAAGVLTVAMLHRGERTLRQLLELANVLLAGVVARIVAFGTGLAAVLAAALGGDAAAARPDWGEGPPLVDRVTAHTIARRGPPLPALA